MKGGEENPSVEEMARGDKKEHIRSAKLPGRLSCDSYSRKRRIKKWGGGSKGGGVGPLLANPGQNWGKKNLEKQIQARGCNCRGRLWESQTVDYVEETKKRNKRSDAQGSAAMAA